MERIYDSSLVPCPNTGLRFNPAEYKSVLDTFYTDTVTRKRNPKADSLGRFLSTDQFLSGEVGGKKKFDGKAWTDPRVH